MGKNQSKEEIVIAQAGNSGGQTSDIDKFTIKNWLEVAVVVLALGVIIAYLYGKCRKRIHKKIRDEIRASQQLV